MSMVVLLRWIHLLSGAAWLGEVVTINFVLVPALLKMNRTYQIAFIRQVFPRIFRLASVLSLSTILSGAASSYLITGWRDLGTWLETRWGQGILIGGLLGLALTLFHFLAERRLEPTASQMKDADLDKVLTVLKVVPRAGLVLIVFIILLMMYATRGT